jgi:hypothetical protein
MLAEPADTIDRIDAPALFRRVWNIADISIGLNGSSPDDLHCSPEMENFQSHSCQSDVEGYVEWSNNLRAQRGEVVFESGALWKLFHDGDEMVFDFTSAMLGVHPYKSLRVDRSFRRIELSLSREALEQHRPVCPLEYPADELLITNYLATGVGVEVHGCGLVDSETSGHLFLGHSGAGKTTTTMLWKSLRNPQILSDDRIILRLQDGELWMYGTPWHGEAAFAIAGKARIRRIFIIDHGDQNQFTPLTRSQAVGEVFARCFPPFHSARGLERTVAFLDQILDTVPCYRFQFVPDAPAVSAVLGFHDD